MALRIFNRNKILCNNKNIFKANLKLSANIYDGIFFGYDQIPVTTFDHTKPDFHTSFHKYLSDMHKNLGPIFIDRTQRDVVYNADPEANVMVFEIDGAFPTQPVLTSWETYLKDNGKKRGLFFTQGEEWHDKRYAFNLLLLMPNVMKNHVQNVSSVCKNLMDIWKIHPPTDILYSLYCWTLECVGAIAFGRNLGFLGTLKYNKANFQDKDEAYFVKALLEIFETTTQLLHMDVALAKSLKSYSWMNFNKAANTAFSYGESFIEKAIQSCKDRFPSDDIRESVVFKALNKQYLHEETIKDVLIDLILSSANTTSHTALWALYLLGRNPDIANKAREEIFSVLKSEKTLTLKTIDKIEYLRGIIKETLRLYPSVASIVRETAHDAKLCNYIIPADTIVSSSLIIMGRDSNNFTFPDEFRPERWWLSELNNSEYINHNRNAATPYAVGRRICVGKRIANLSLSLLLIEALTTFEWTVEKEVDMIMKLVTAPSEDIQMKFTLL